MPESKIKEMIKPLLLGAICGAILTIIIGYQRATCYVLRATVELSVVTQHAARLTLHDYLLTTLLYCITIST